MRRFTYNMLSPSSTFKLMLGLLLTIAPLAHVWGLNMDVLTCADIQEVNAALYQDHVVARFADLSCDDWVTVVVHEVDEERQLRIESLHAGGGQLQLANVRFDVGHDVEVTFATDVRITRSAHHPFHASYVQVRWIDGGRGKHENCYGVWLSQPCPTAAFI